MVGVRMRSLLLLRAFALLVVCSICAAAISQSGSEDNAGDLSTHTHKYHKRHSRHRSGRSSSPCPSYTLVVARGTREAQGPSMSFIDVNARILAKVPGGVVYNVRYPADTNQNWGLGSQDVSSPLIVAITRSFDNEKNGIMDYLTSVPVPLQIARKVEAGETACYLLFGWSQGAAAVVTAMSKLSHAATHSVKAVILYGDPLKYPGLPCNVDGKGGKSTAQTYGNMVPTGKGNFIGIPAAWVPKTLDICLVGDGVCGVNSNFPVT